MKLRSAPMVGCLTLMLGMGPNIDCDDILISSAIDGLWFAASIGVNQALTAANQAGNDGTDNQAGQPAPGAPGEPGLDCWDLNGNGIEDLEEDLNGDGVWDALDCQGPQGEQGSSGSAGLPGQDGQDGAQGDQGDSGEQGEQGGQGAQGDPGQDLTGVIARGVIPADGDFNGVSGSGIVYVEHPELGVYYVGVELPDGSLPADPEDFATLITIELNGTGGGGGLAALLFGYYEAESITDNVLRVEVQIRTITNALRNSDFSIAVFGP